MGYKAIFFQILNFSRERKTLVTIIAGRIGVALSSIFAVKLSTVLLKPAELGSLSELNSLVYLFFITLIVPVSHFITRGFLEWNDSGTLTVIAKKYVTYILIIALLTGIISGILQWNLSVIDGFNYFSVALLVTFSLIFQPINGFGISGLNLFGQRQSYTFFTNLVAWSSLILSVLIFYIYKNKISWSVGQILGFAIGSLSILILWKKINKTAKVDLIENATAIPFSRKSIILFSWPFVFTSSLWWLQTQSYRFILGVEHGIDNVGYFVTAYALAATPIMISEGIIAQYLEPSFYNNLKYQDHEGQTKAWNEYARLFLPGIVVVSAFVAASTPFLAKIFLGGAFRSAAMKITIWAALIEAMRSAGTMMFQLGMAKLDNKMTIWPAAAGAVTAPIAVYLLSKIDPLYGTIVGLLIAAVVVLVTNVVLSYRVLPVYWPIERIGYGLLLALPILLIMQIISYFFPQPGYILSFLSLFIAAIYIGIVVFYLLSSKYRKI